MTYYSNFKIAAICFAIGERPIMTAALGFKLKFFFLKTYYSGFKTGTVGSNYSQIWMTYCSHFKTTTNRSTLQNFHKAYCDGFEFPQ